MMILHPDYCQGPKQSKTETGVYVSQYRLLLEGFGGGACDSSRYEVTEDMEGAGRSERSAAYAPPQSGSAAIRLGSGWT